MHLSVIFSRISCISAMCKGGGNSQHQQQQIQGVIAAETPVYDLPAKDALDIFTSGALLIAMPWPACSVLSLSNFIDSAW